MKIPKWMVPPPEWKPQPVEPWWLWRGRRFFWLLAVMGTMCFLGSFCGLAEGLLDAIAMAILGVGLTAGAGGTLALSYEKVPQEEVFLVKVLCRVGFMATGPAAFGLTMVYEPFDPGTEGKYIALAAAVFCGATMLPFGASLLKLLLKHRREKVT